jgi:mono/diheme cytochrome c family protein
MDRRVGFVLLLALVMPSAAMAQQLPTNTSLNDTQKLGQRLFVQSCGVCHMKPQLGAPNYGPPLSKDSLGGQEDVMRATIADGTPRMPGFKHQFDQTQIAAIASFLKTLPAPK